MPGFYRQQGHRRAASTAHIGDMQRGHLSLNPAETTGRTADSPMDGEVGLPSMQASPAQAVGPLRSGAMALSDGKELTLSKYSVRWKGHLIGAGASL